MFPPLEKGARGIFSSTCGRARLGALGLGGSDNGRFEHSLSLMLVGFPGVCMGTGHEIYNRPLITAKVTTTFSLSRCTQISYGSFLSTTAVSRLNLFSWTFSKSTSG